MESPRAAYGRVDPPDDALPRSDARVVDCGDERREDGRGRGRAALADELAALGDDDGGSTCGALAFVPNR